MKPLTQRSASSISAFPLLLICLALLFISGCSKQARQSRYAARGDEYFRKERFAEAELEYLNALRYAPKDTALLRKLGNVFYQQGRIASALQAFQMVKQSQPEDIESAARIADLFYTFRDYRKSREEALGVLKRQSINDTALLLIAETSLNATQSLEAAQFINQAATATKGPGPRIAAATLRLQERDFAGAEQQLKLASASSPPSPQIDLITAKLRMMQTNFPDAEALLKRAAAASPPRSTYRLAYADFQMLRGNTPACQQTLEEITKKAPDYLPAWIRLANLALVQNRFQDCDALTKKALGVESSSHEALLLRSRMWTVQGDFEKALNELHHLDAFFPNNPSIKFELATTHARAGEYVRALALVGEALKLDPRLAQATLLQARLNLHTGNSAAAVSSLVKLVQAHPELREPAALLAAAYVAQRRPDDAVKVYRDLATRYPGDPEPWSSIGLILLSSKDNRGARSAFEQSLKLAPNYPVAVEQLVNLDIRDLNYSSALARANRLQNALTNSALGFLLEANIHSATNGLAAAETALLKGAAREPNSLVVYGALADLYIRSGNHDKAIEKLDAITERNPKSFAAWTQKGMIHEKTRSFQKAADAYRRALAINGAFAPALNNLAVLLGNDPKQLDEAVSLARRAREGATGDPAISDTLGWLLVKRGDFLEARRLLGPAAESLKHPEVAFHAGVACYDTGDESGASQWLAAALADSRLLPESRRDAEQRMAVLNVNLQSPTSAQVTLLEQLATQTNPDGIALQRLAAINLAQGRRDKAIEGFIAASRVNPEAVPPLLSLSQAFASSDPRRALEYARKARTLAPHDPAVALSLGSLLVRDHDYSSALGFLLEAQRANPAFGPWLNDLAVAQFAAGRVSDAVSTLNTFIARSEGAAKSQSQQTLLLIGIDPLERKVAIADGRLKQDPKDIVAIAISAEIAAGRSQFSKAIELYEQALSVAPGFTPANKALAVLYLERGSDDKAAFSNAIKAREAMPNDPEIARVLGKLALKRNDYSEALRFLSEATVSAKDGEPYHLIGMANLRLKRSNEARVAFTKAAALPLKPDVAAENSRMLSELKQ